MNFIINLYETVDSYRKLVDKNCVIYHTFQLKPESAFSVVIKGLHHSTPITDSRANFLLLEHQVRSVRNIISHFTKQPLPMFFVDLDSKPNNSEIFDLRTFGRATKKNVDIVQCFRCQQFGHTRNYCRQPYRCVKCGLEDSTSEYTKSPNSPPQCVHYLSNHIANYKGCEVYQELVNKRSYKSVKSIPEQNNFNYNTTSRQLPRTVN